ncbi:hypothetical protein BHE74_00047559, partial [Ensete ventricosum]
GGEGIGDGTHGPHLHLQRRDVVRHLLQQRRQRQLPAAGDQPAQDPRFLLQGRRLAPLGRRRPGDSGGADGLRPEATRPDPALERPAGEDRAAPPRPAARRSRQSPVRRLPDGAAPRVVRGRGRSRRRRTADAAEGLDELGGVRPLLALRPPLGQRRLLPALPLPPPSALLSCRLPFRIRYRHPKPQTTTFRHESLRGLRPNRLQIPRSEEPKPR